MRVQCPRSLEDLIASCCCCLFFLCIQYIVHFNLKLVFTSVGGFLFSSSFDKTVHVWSLQVYT